MLDISDIITAEFGTTATLNGVALPSGAVIQPGADMGMQHNADTPAAQRTALGEFAKITIRKADLPAGVTPQYRDVVSSGGKDWALQANILERGESFECVGVCQYRAGGKR